MKGTPYTILGFAGVWLIVDTYVDRGKNIVTTATLNYFANVYLFTVLMFSFVIFIDFESSR